MALLTAEIEAVMNSGGFIRFADYADKNYESNSHVIGVCDSYSMAQLTVNSGSNTIVIGSKVAATSDYNCVNVHTLDQESAIGPVATPGYVYTGNFSGCVFYLYKTGANEVTGVHAYSGLKGVAKKRFLRKPKITNVVHEFGPQNHFLGSGGSRMICRHPTRGQLQTGAYIGDPASEDSLNFLSCVERTTATTFLFATKPTLKGVTIKRLIGKFVDNY